VLRLRTLEQRTRALDPNLLLKSRKLEAGSVLNLTISIWACGQTYTSHPDELIGVANISLDDFLECDPASPKPFTCVLESKGGPVDQTAGLDFF
jgi:hypothetical protein